MCLQELCLRITYFCRARSAVVRADRASARWSDDPGDVRAGPAARHRPGRAGLRGRPDRVYYNRPDMIDAGGSYLGNFPQNAHPRIVHRALGEDLFPARRSRLSGLRDPGRQGRCLYLLRRPFPRRSRCLGLNRAEIVFDPSATVVDCRNISGSSSSLRTPSANGYFVGSDQSARVRRVLADR